MQRILGLVRRCVEDYHMIEPGDRVAVGVSGGKDSLLTLAALYVGFRLWGLPGMFLMPMLAITLISLLPGRGE